MQKLQKVHLFFCYPFSILRYLRKGGIDLVERLSGAVLHLLTATPPYVVVRKTRHLGKENSMRAGSLEKAFKTEKIPGKYLPATTTKARVAAVRRSTIITTSQLSLRKGIRNVLHAISLPCITIVRKCFTSSQD